MADRVVAGGARDQPLALRLVLGPDAALLHHLLIKTLDPRDTFIECLAGALEDLHGNTGVGEAHGDPRTHGAGADHCG